VGEIILRLSTFKNGIHPKDFKYYSEGKKIEKMSIPEEVFVPLQQHIGKMSNPIVEKGEEVKTGQIIAEADGFISSTIHSPITGKVKAIDEFNHPSGVRSKMIHIKKTGDDEWELIDIPEDWKNSTKEELLGIVKKAGIVGLGGAAFPTQVKLSPPKNKPIDSFILNGVECEPYLTADHRMMLEYTDKVLDGMAITMKILGVKNGYIGIENNKLDAIKKMQERISKLNYNFKVLPLKLKYPQGAEKMLIDAILKRQVPAGGLPMDVGVVVNNVGTVYSVFEAVTEGKPLIRRVVTMTGDGINEPKNILARIGTTFKELMEFSGGLKDETNHIYMGGPMMGVSQHATSVPIIKATSGIVCSIKKDEKSYVYPCIRCGTCVKVCPMNLIPTKLSRLSELGEYDELEKYDIQSCIECGSCLYSCPSNIPLVQWIRVGKLKSN
jgi:electron transport complex protein RnfC